MFDFEHAKKTRKVVVYGHDDFMSLRMSDCFGFAGLICLWSFLSGMVNLAVDSEILSMASFLVVALSSFMFTLGLSKLGGEKTFFRRAGKPGRFTISAALKDALALVLWPLIVWHIEAKCSVTDGGSIEG